MKNNRQRLVVIEEELKSMIDKDINDPKIYDKIFELVYKFLLRNKIVFDYTKAEEIATTMSEDLYLRLFDPSKSQIRSWLGYISLDYHNYLRSWKKENDTVLETYGDIDLSNAIICMYAGSMLDDGSISDIYNIDYVASLPMIIDQILENSKIQLDTSVYVNTKITLLLSILYDKFISYRLSPSDSNYARMLYRVLCDKLMLELHPKVPNENLNILQFYLLDDGYESGFERWIF